MKRSVELNWVEDLVFEVDTDGQKMMIDANMEQSDKPRGFRPKALMMVSLAGCTAIDVIDILNKMRVPIEGLSISVDGKLRDELPKDYRSMHVTYVFRGKDLSREKLERAVELSKEKYCGVSATLVRAIELTYEIKIEEQPLSRP
ncbi:MAG: OsmC family protein [Bacteroidales bacterium]|jgi:putative redox protein|nr:OsmC family protein [Bacteroidales bacterium]NLM93014.1 OsmC family protein [Bacteroidales bacterium]